MQEVAQTLRETGAGGAAPRPLTSLLNLPQVDPQKGKWGGQSAANGFQLAATVKQLVPDLGNQPAIHAVLLRVNDTQRRSEFEGSDVTFHLHPTFNPDTVRIVARNAEALYSTRAWGAFTVGVELFDGTKLELGFEYP